MAATAGKRRYDRTLTNPSGKGRPGTSRLRAPSRSCCSPERDVLLNDEPSLADLSEVLLWTWPTLLQPRLDSNVTGSIAPDQETTAAADRNEPLLSEAHLEWRSWR